MKNNWIVRSAAAAATLAVTAAAHAQATAPAAPPAPEPPFPLTANISVTTKYKFRGQDQAGVTFNDEGRARTKMFVPALQGGFDWTGLGGFYVGNWNSTSDLANAAIEMDLYAGYKGTIGGGFGYDAGALYYYYPQKDKSLNLNTVELYGALSWEWVTLKYSHTVSPDYFGAGELQEIAGAERGKGRNTGYLELNANYPVVEGLTINGHLGYTRFSKDLKDADTAGGDIGLKNYYDYKLGVTYDLSAFAGTGVSVAAAYVGANKKNYYGSINKGRAIFTLTKAF